MHSTLIGLLFAFGFDSVKAVPHKKPIISITNDVPGASSLAYENATMNSTMPASGDASTNATQLYLDVVINNGSSVITSREPFWATDLYHGSDYSVSSINNALWGPVLDRLSNPVLVVVDDTTYSSFQDLQSISGIVSTSACQAPNASNVSQPVTIPYENVTTWNTTTGTNTTTGPAETCTPNMNTMVASLLGINSNVLVNYQSAKIFIVGQPSVQMTTVSVKDSVDGAPTQTVSQQVNNVWDTASCSVVQPGIEDIFGSWVAQNLFYPSASVVTSFMHCTEQDSALALAQAALSEGITGGLYVPANSRGDNAFLNLFGTQPKFFTGTGNSVLIVQAEQTCSWEAWRASKQAKFIDVSSESTLNASVITAPTPSWNMTTPSWNESSPGWNESAPAWNMTDTWAPDYASGIYNYSEGLDSSGDGRFVVISSASNTTYNDFYIIGNQTVVNNDVLLPVLY
ncbi:hypothetical protein SJAG_05279 [Schizosaccharomyces japonicus yFS275]|uniref:Uncharacterized protein n=1 Tax=Schizosaccharomyces japonicus (strain yFS275 / FY16936) TaxID=402676 RepID=B6K183_SCHJY|nr:hypothetical protein SJAG_05279 [Schizosaccharomyces japonicus yFS275]EEB07704.1 hypothetical protein SJAG_05279 [Schizosaccharomyces japonicus yFS275]